MDINKFIGNKMREFREARNKTQEDIAQLLNTTSQTISRYEKGDRKPGNDILFELAKYYKVSINEFYPEIDVKFGSELEKDLQAVSLQLNLPINVTKNIFLDLTKQNKNQVKNLTRENIKIDIENWLSSKSTNYTDEYLDELEILFNKNKDILTEDDKETIKFLIEKRKREIDKQLGED